MRKPVNLSTLPDAAPKFTTQGTQSTGYVSLTGCLQIPCILFHTYTTPTTKDYF